MSNYENNEEIQIFREYLQIPSVHPNINYEPCVEFLKKQAKSLDLPVSIYYPVNDKNPVVVLTWMGSQPELPAIVLNSHMDVVPVFEEHWTHPPFAADIDKDGKIFARGAQDMKCVGVQYLAAIRALKRDGIQQLKRTIYVIFVPDEEVGGYLGMAEFVKTDEFKAMNIAFSLDEGIASSNEEFNVYYAERTIWQIEFICHGKSCHGMMLVKNTPGEKIHYIVDKLMTFRENEAKKLENNPELSLGDVTTVNMTMLKGGVQGNVVPPELNVTFDIRIANNIKLNDFENLINQWCAESGSDIELRYIHKFSQAPITATDNSNIYWIAFKEAIDELKLKVKAKVFPGATDSRYIRMLNIPALGFSPMNNIPILLHDNDEYIPADIYLTGIRIYKKIIANLANV